MQTIRLNTGAPVRVKVQVLVQSHCKTKIQKSRNISSLNLVLILSTVLKARCRLTRSHWCVELKVD